jgi:hypothetical protein
VAVVFKAVGEVIGQTAARHTSEDFLAFLAQALDAQPRRRAVHIIPDNVADLRRRILRYIRCYNTTATPIRWSYADPSRHIA